MSDALAALHPAVGTWFREAFAAPTRAQELAWPAIAEAQSTLLLAPTGSGKTLAAFLVALDRLMFESPPAEPCTRVLYISPLKALGVDVERNLRAPLAGLSAVARRDGHAYTEPSVGVRSGDTPPRERVRLVKNPPDILITTPESLYLMLTSRARETLRAVQTVIVDEIHSLCSTKRGAHLMLSLERVETLRREGAPSAPVSALSTPSEPPALQRIGLSATQRPLDEVARFLGGAELDGEGVLSSRPVTIVDAGRTKEFDLRVEVPVEDMTAPRAGSSSSVHVPELDDDGPPGPKPAPSIWPAMHPRLLELIRAHRSTMIFVNSRRLAEKLAAAINELAEEEVALAHHGSIAKDARAAIEDRLKRGQLPAIVATSSLELGIDMGAVDLVLQIEAPPSVASGIQRIGRAGHHVGEVSRGILFPKFRGDLLACAAVVEHTRAGHVEETRYPRNPLDVLAQHIVSLLVEGPRDIDDVYALVRRAAPFADLARPVFEGVLDMLSGRYPSERFRELRPRINWDRTKGTLEARRGARLLAVANPGTIVDRGLYGVYLAGSDPAVRVGELDEEMVFESRAGEVFLLGASSWRIEDISHDRVTVTPAPGEPGRMPFWRGDKPGRPLEFGIAIGKLTAELAELSADEAIVRLRQQHGLNDFAAQNLVAYLQEQSQQSALPTDRCIVLEAFTDEVGDWRVVVLSPFGGRVHAPWSIVVGERLRQELGVDVDSMWADDGMVFRLPDSDEAPAANWFLPTVEQAEEVLRSALGTTALFAAHFRENASRALLLPRRRPGKRMPLWVQRRRSSDLLSVATEFSDFPMVLETYRECLQDVFDLRGLSDILRGVGEGRIRTREVTTQTASPFAASLLFSYVGNFIYDGDAPLAERRAQALSLDHDQLRLLLGEPELRELLDADAITELERRLQRLDTDWPLRCADDLHDLLLTLGDLSDEELDARMEPELRHEWFETLARQGRAVRVRIASELRTIAGEDAARYRDALGVVLPMGVVDAFLRPLREPLSDLLLRFAKTHGPFVASAIVERYRLAPQVVDETLRQLERAGVLVRGAFLPHGLGQEYCSVEVLRRLKQVSLAKLRRQIEPVEPEVYTRFLQHWQHLAAPLSGLDGVLTVIEQLQGVELSYSVLTREVLPSRVDDFRSGDLDDLCAAGEIIWRGSGQQAGDTRLSFYLADEFTRLAPLTEAPTSELGQKVEALLRERGALFFSDIVETLGVFPGEAFDVLWTLVTTGRVSNDTLQPVASLLAGQGRSSRTSSLGRRGFRSRRQLRPGTEGRWTLLPDTGRVTTTERARAGAEQLVRRFGVLTREAVRGAAVSGGFSFVYPVLKALEEGGRLRRGYFIAGYGATQFAANGAEAQLRRHRQLGEKTTLSWLAATDPANPYGVCLPWPEFEGARPTRTPGCHVVLHQGRLLAYSSRGSRALTLYRHTHDEPPIELLGKLAESLVERLDNGTERALLIESIDGIPVTELDTRTQDDATWARSLSTELVGAGFSLGPKGLQKRRGALGHPTAGTRIAKRGSSLQ